MRTEKQIEKDVIDTIKSIEILSAHSTTGKERDANAFQLICARERLKTLKYVLEDKKTK